MISATESFAAPSTVSWPEVFELMVSIAVLEGSAQPTDTTYQSGSLAASTSLSNPSVRQGRRPTAGRAQLPAAIPSLLVPKLPGASGQGNRLGLFSVACAARCAT